jgi:hypothetical protein
VWSNTKLEDGLPSVPPPQLQANPDIAGIGVRYTKISNIFLDL